MDKIQLTLDAHEAMAQIGMELVDVEDLDKAALRKQLAILTQALRALIKEEQVEESSEGVPWKKVPVGKPAGDENAEDFCEGVQKTNDKKGDREGQWALHGIHNNAPYISLDICAVYVTDHRKDNLITVQNLIGDEHTFLLDELYFFEDDGIQVLGNYDRNALALDQPADGDWVQLSCGYRLNVIDGESVWAQRGTST